MNRSSFLAPTALAVTVAFAALAAVACTAAATEPVDSAPGTDRAVAVSTTACGHTSKTVGSGVVVGDGLVLTAAHVVIGATDISLTTGARTTAASVVRLDRTTDLAVLAAPGLGNGLGAIETAAALPGDPVTFHGASSGAVATTIGRALDLRVDDVRAATRSLRNGYDLDVRLMAGDSGGGVFDSADRLVAIVFSAPVASDTGRERTYAVGWEELDRILDAPDGRFVCDSSKSQLTSQ